MSTERNQRLVQEAREWGRQRRIEADARLAAMTPEERQQWEEAQQSLMDRMASGIPRESVDLK